jgi:homoaconitase/3-isopropylmalate dehydratase large subunit
VWVLYVKEDGATERMTEGRRYDEQKEIAVFKTDHLSVYTVVYESVVNEPVTPGGDGVGCDAGALAAIALGIGGAVLGLGKKRKG